MCRCRIWAVLESEPCFDGRTFINWSLLLCCANPHPTSASFVVTGCAFRRNRCTAAAISTTFDTMTLPAKNIATIAPLVGLILIGWIVEVFGLYFLQKSCHKHATPAWAAAAGFPAVGTCWKMYRFEWATILVELITVLGLMFTLTSELQPLAVFFLQTLEQSCTWSVYACCLVCKCCNNCYASRCSVFSVHMNVKVWGCFDFCVPLQRPMPSEGSACHSWVC